MWAVIVAAGSGSRFGGAKQYSLLGGRPVVEWSVRVARDTCDGVVLVLPDPVRPDPVRPDPVLPDPVLPDPVLPDTEDALADAVVTGGATRSASVRNGLAQVPADAEVIVVHDAARPLATPDLFEAVIAAVDDGADGALCAVPLTDTIRLTSGGTVDRAELLAVQTPQAFRAAALRAAHAGGDDATDDAALVEANGGRVVVVSGSPTNVKITHPHDLVVAAALLEARR